MNYKLIAEKQTEIIEKLQSLDDKDWDIAERLIAEVKRLESEPDKTDRSKCCDYPVIDFRTKTRGKIRCCSQCLQEVEPDIDLTDEHIQSYARRFCTTSTGLLSPLVETGIIIGAKAMRDGNIKINNE
jgi:hypothetical protein